MSYHIKPFDVALAHTCEQLFAIGQYDLTCGAIAGKHYKGASIGPDALEEVRCRLPCVRQHLEALGYIVMLVTQKYFEMVGGPKDPEEMRACIAGSSWGTRAMGIKLISEKSDSLWMQLLNLHIRQDRGKIRAQKQRIESGVREKLLTKAEVLELAFEDRQAIKKYLLELEENGRGEIAG